MEELFEQELAAITTKPYSVFYTDGSYVVYDLTKEDYDKIKDAMMKPVVAHKNWVEVNTVYIPVVELSIGLMKLTDIRSVIVQRPVQENKAINPMLTDDEIVWLSQVKRSSMLEEEGEDSEYNF